MGKVGIRWICTVLLALMAFVLGTVDADAKTTTWTGGAASSDWNIAGNWDNGVPGSGDDAVIVSNVWHPKFSATVYVKNLKIDTTSGNVVINLNGNDMSINSGGSIRLISGGNAAQIWGRVRLIYKAL